MSVDRPTFHESWSRVATLRPRLRETARVRRQPARGLVWRVVEDSAGLRWFRMSDPAWRFVGLLDGRTTVDEAWRAACGELGDDAPTQGEAIQILSQLSEANLLQGDLPGDAELLFQRQRKRSARERRSQLASLLFLKVPLVDPDRWLTRWTPAVAWLYTPVGLALWLALLAIGGWRLAGRGAELASAGAGALAPSNLPLLFVVWVIVKTAHELAHAFACKAIGRRVGGGEVRSMGLLFMLLLPVPYVDASSSWAFRGVRSRVLVASAGMMSDLALAAAAAILWTSTPEGSTLHALAHNAIIVAGVATLLFNANPLMRYDAYYILADLTQTPNLAQRSTEQLKHLARTLLFGVRRARGPAHSRGEAWWLGVYGALSLAYRLVVYVGLALFIAGQQLLLGLAILLCAAVTWVALPAGRFVHYLLTSPELDRSRPRAALATLGVAAGAFTLLGLVPAPDRVRAEGVVEPAEFAIVTVGSEGFAREWTPSGAPVKAGDALLVAESAQWRARRDELEAESRRVELERRAALRDDFAAAQRLGEQLDAVRDQLRFAEETLDRLTARAPIDGVWIAPGIDRVADGYVRRGDTLGMVAPLDAMVVRAVADQRASGELERAAAPGAHVSVRAKGRPESGGSGHVELAAPAGQSRLPSESLGFGAGGGFETRVEEGGSGVSRTAEPVFEVRIALEPGHDLRAGQRVVARFELPWKPLAAQWWRDARRALQQRFRT